MKNVLLIHNIPAPYRIEFFNQLSKTLGKKNINFHIIFQVMATKRRRFWHINSKKMNFSYEVSKSIRLGHYLNQLRIPLLPFYEYTKNAPDIIIATGFNLHSISAFLYTRKNKIPLIIWTGEQEIKGFCKDLRILVRKLILRYTEYVFVYGSAARDFYNNKFNFPISKMATLLNVIPVRHNINVNEQITLKISELKRKRLRLIFVGDLKKAKGIFYLPNVLKELTSMFPKYSIEFIILGSGPEAKRFKKRLDLIKNHIDIRFLGLVSNEEVLFQIAKSHFLMFPTLGEPWGHVITESFSVGTPVITSKFAGAVPDIIKEGENGHVVNFEDPYYVGKKIFMSINEFRKYKNMCISAKNFYHEIFSSVNNTRTFMDVVTNLWTHRN